MAEIVDLTADIEDCALTERLRRAADGFTQNRRCGLVYEQYIPETAALPGVVPRVGDHNSQVSVRSR